ncbi:PD-(D/E)XK nuclease family protein, partial [Mangrovactinospora gilvigrisea]|uniref:PD-(D/E)XK nuclease family protein n=1 Tax=Mangrovactinospora gilvigrisea TaxID=1428644 RepID=UPI000B28BE91
REPDGAAPSAGPAAGGPSAGDAARPGGSGSSGSAGDDGGVARPGSSGPFRPRADAVASAGADPDGADGSSGAARSAGPADDVPSAGDPAGEDSDAARPGSSGPARPRSDAVASAGADPEREPDGAAPSVGPAAGGAVLDADSARIAAAWDRDLAALAEELRRSRRGTREVPLPGTLSASQLLRVAADPDGFARELARPMPRPPSPAARRGTAFHAWVESRFEPLPLLEPEELPGMEGEDEITDDRDLAALKDAFLRTPYAELRPYRVEAPFQLRLGTRLLRGRIDAVYRDPESGDFEIVDWKTNRTETADPLQLAVYRLAWAELAGVPVERVTAAFLYVRSGRVVRPEPLPDRAELTTLLDGEHRGE